MGAYRFYPAARKARMEGSGDVPSPDGEVWRHVVSNCLPTTEHNPNNNPNTTKTQNNPKQTQYRSVWVAFGGGGVMFCGVWYIKIIYL